MNQLPENSPLPQSNPFAAPSVAAAESVHPVAGEMMLLTQYSLVRKGLQLIYYSIATIAGIFVLMMVLGVALGAAGGAASLGGGTLFLLVGIVSLVAMLVMLVGFCMTIACPRPDEKPRAIISVLCFFLAFGVSLVGRMVLFRLTTPSNLAAASVGLSLTTNILYIASSVLFCLLLKRIGRNVSSSRLEKSARSMLVWYGILFVVVLVGGGAMSFAAYYAIGPNPSGASGSFLSSTQLWGIVGGLVMLVVSLTVLFKYLAMLRAGIDELTVKNHG